MRRQTILCCTSIVGVLIVGIWETMALWGQHARAPTDGHWQTLSAALRDNFRPGDPVLVSPEWAEPRAYAFLKGVLTNELASLHDIDRFSRVWEISLNGARHAWLEGMTPVRSLTFGPLSLHRYQQNATAITYDFLERLAEARVTELGDTLEICDLKSPKLVRFQCPNAQRISGQSGSWHWVGKGLFEIGFRPHRCIYAHPVPGKRLLVSFSQVPLGKRLVGYTGITDFRSRRAAKAPVRFNIEIDTQRVLSQKHQNEWPWHRFEVNTAAFEGSEHRVTFEISANDTRARPFCFHAEARK